MTEGQGASGVSNSDSEATDSALAEKPAWAPQETPALLGLPADQPVPTDPVEGITLETYAQISAQLAEGRSEPETILAEHQLMERNWPFIEQEWALRMAAAALRGDLSLAQQYDVAYVAAQSELGPEQPTHPLADYAVFSAELELGLETAPVVLARRGLSIADFARLSRYWNALLGKDPALLKTFRAQVADHKARVAGEREAPDENTPLDRQSY